MASKFRDVYGFDGIDSFFCPELDRDDLFSLVAALDLSIRVYERRMVALLDDGKKKSDLLSLRARRAAALDLRQRLLTHYQHAVEGMSFDVLKEL